MGDSDLSSHKTRTRTC